MCQWLAVLFFAIAGPFRAAQIEREAPPELRGRTSPLQLAIAIATVLLVLLIVALPIVAHAERRHSGPNPGQRAIFYRFCLYGSTLRQCAVAAEMRR